MKEIAVYLAIVCVMFLEAHSLMAAERWFGIKWVADGDTIFLKDGRHIRFIGINAPEIAHPETPAEPFGYEAKDFLTQLVKKRKVRLEWDEVRYDRYGRELAYVFDQKNQLLNQVLVANGLAYILYHKDNQRYFKSLLKSQQTAITQKKGFWKKFHRTDKYQYFVGNQRTLRFHSPRCKEAKKISRKNYIRFVNSQVAFQKGYAPAKGCLKGIGSFIK